MNLLKQSTEIKVRIGPFVDVSDGFTPETGVALSTADEAELLKADGAATVSISAATWAAVTGADGWYDLTLTTSHTDTVGELLVVVQDDSVCLPVHARFQVVEEAVYDALFAGSAAGELAVKLSTQGKADVNAEADAALSDYGANTTTPPTAAAVADAVLDEAMSGHTTPGTLGKAVADVLEDTGTTLPSTLSTISTNVLTLVTKLTTGITSLAEWLGLLAGKQAGDATALTEIRATGAGSGTYDPTTDSGEAIRDTAPLGTAMRGTDSAYTGTPPTAAQNATELLDQAAGVETNRTVRGALRLILSACVGKMSGGATTTNTFRDTNDSKDRITATVDADGNRSAVTLDDS